MLSAPIPPLVLALSIAIWMITKRQHGLFISASETYVIGLYVFIL
uniref:Uncharacterized protein n=1 Tax=Anguilla anguilla TaxID=7936 RepID=A0A0E9S2Q4_ANGAN